MEVRGDRRYTEEHEWLQPGSGDRKIRVGITDYAQDALGDVVFVALPEIGKSVSAGDTMAEVESTKSVGEVYAPLAGTVVEVNALLASQPELINSDPYGEGWIVVLETEAEPHMDRFLDADAYQALTE